jgi:hypothetical protein
VAPVFPKNSLGYAVLFSRKPGERVAARGKDPFFRRARGKAAPLEAGPSYPRATRAPASPRAPPTVLISAVAGPEQQGPFRGWPGGPERFIVGLAATERDTASLDPGTSPAAKNPTA